MARRGGPSRRMQNNPLGSILRDLDRRSRSSTRRGGKSEPAPTMEGPRGQRGPRGPAGPPGDLPGAATVLVTEKDGRARWDYGELFDRQPVLTASIAGLGPLLAVWETAEESHAVLRVWSVPTGTPAGAGVHVHVSAEPARG